MKATLPFNHAIVTTQCKVGLRLVNSAKIGCDSSVCGAKQALQVERLVYVLVACADVLLLGHGLAETNWIKLAADVELGRLERGLVVAALADRADLAANWTERTLVLRLRGRCWSVGRRG